MAELGDDGSKFDLFDEAPSASEERSDGEESGTPEEEQGSGGDDSSDGEESSEEGSDEEEEEAGEQESLLTTTESEPLTAREQAMLAQMEKMQRAQLAPPVASGTPKLTITKKDRNFLEGKDLDEVLGDPAQLNAVIQEAVQYAIEEAANTSLEATFRSLPDTVITYVRQQIEAHELINTFYGANSDLVPVKVTMGNVANEIAVEHPEYTVNQILEESAKKVRTMLGLKKAQEPVKRAGAKNAERSPAFIKPKGSSRVKKEELQGLQKEIMDLVNL